ncbi:hypothetical protein JO40_11620 [Treponema putidum]|nr:hypothetical protein [Treponema putidum]AIN94655.1 hypothetical protein JO40_11620 [Treponema putidum]
MTLDINLQINGKNITDIATLKENFSLDYILEAYKNKKLEKWLIAGGFMDYLEKIVEIDINQCDLYLAMQLIMVFDIRFSNIEEKKIIAAYTKCNKNASFDETNIINHVPKKIQYIIKNPTDNLITESSFLNL